MPMLHFRCNIDDITGFHLLSRFSPLLIISTSGSAEQNLSAFVMNMPVISASWLKGYICNSNSFRCQHGQVTLSNKILCIRIIFSPNGNICLNPFSVMNYSPFKN